jgi:hypothetical protein
LPGLRCFLSTSRTRALGALFALALMLVVATSACYSQPGGGEVRSVDSTAYCLRGTMANGEQVHDGAVAMNNVPFGARWKVLSGSMAGRIFTVKDRIGHSSEFDIWMSSCDAAWYYGRQQIHIERVG